MKKLIILVVIISSIIEGIIYYSVSSLMGRDRTYQEDVILEFAVSIGEKYKHSFEGQGEKILAPDEIDQGHVHKSNTSAM